MCRRGDARVVRSTIHDPLGAPTPRRRTFAAVSWRLQLEGGTTCRTWTRSPGRWTFSATHRRTMVVSAEALPSTGTRSTRASRPRSDHDGGTGGAVGVVASVVSPARSPPPSRVAMAAAREGRCASGILDARRVWSRAGHVVPVEYLYHYRYRRRPVRYPSVWNRTSPERTYERKTRTGRGSNPRRRRAKVRRGGRSIASGPRTVSPRAGRHRVIPMNSITRRDATRRDVRRISLASLDFATVQRSRLPPPPTTTT